MMDKKKNLALCGVFYVFAGAYLMGTIKMSKDNSQYPRFVGVVILVVTTLFLIQVLLSRNTGQAESWKIDHKRFFTVFLAGVIYLGIMNIAGYYPATFAFMVTVLILLKQKKLTALFIGTGFCLFVFAIFKTILGVPVPEGVLF